MARLSKTNNETTREDVLAVKPSYVVDTELNNMVEQFKPVNCRIQALQETPDRVTLALINGAAVELIQRKIYVEQIIQTAKEINEKLNS